jgi:hypothetical protein
MFTSLRLTSIVCPHLAPLVCKYDAAMLDCDIVRLRKTAA